MIEVWPARGVLGRASALALARIVLASRLGLWPDQVPLRRRCRRCGATDHGKPYVEGDAIYFSISSAGDRVTLATAPVPIGIDLVRVATITPDDAGAILAQGEEADDARGLATLWARKEAILKTTGEGLAIDPRFVRVSPPDASAALLAWPAGDTRGVQLRDLHTGVQEGYVSCVAWLSGSGAPIVVHGDATALLKGAHR